MSVQFNCFQNHPDGRNFLCRSILTGSWRRASGVETRKSLIITCSISDPVERSRYDMQVTCKAGLLRGTICAELLADLFSEKMTYMYLYTRVAHRGALIVFWGVLRPEAKRY